MVVVIMAVALAVLMGLFFWWLSTKGVPNEDPGIGTNRPWPGGIYGSPEPPYLPDPTIGPTEEFQMEADRSLNRLFARQRARRRRVRSWMDEPGAFERDGLDDAAPSDSDRTGAPTIEPRHKHKHGGRHRH